MFLKSKKIRKNVLIELSIKSYSQYFLENFYHFFKQRFFKNFIRLGEKTFNVKKYTILRSAFVNKSSRDQVEKRIFRTKIFLLFTDIEFKSFYNNLITLNFKGISIRLKKNFSLNVQKI